MTITPITVIQSEDELLAVELRATLFATWRAEGVTERKLYAPPNIPWEEIVAEMSSTSFFNDQTLFDIRLPDGKIGRDGAKWIDTLIPLANDEQRLLISLPLDWKLQKSAWLSRLVQSADNHELKKPNRAQFPQWLSQRLQALKIKLTPEALHCLGEWVDGNLLAADQEIRKLAFLYGGHTEPLSAQIVRECTLNVSHYDSADFRTAWLSGDWKLALRILHRLEGEGEPPMLIARMMNEDLRKALRVASHLRDGQSEFEALRREGLFYDRAKLIAQFAKRLDIAKIYSLFLGAEMLEMAAKGALSDEVWSIFARVVLTAEHKRPLIPAWSSYMHA